MRTFVLGDIHGALPQLDQVLERSGIDPKNDRLIQIGDICDRGLFSYEVVEKLKLFSHLILIEGNHDTWLKAYMNGTIGEEYQSWLTYGGKEALNSYKRNKQEPSVHKEFYDQQLPYFIDEQNRCFVHAGFHRSFPIKGQPLEFITFDREMANEMLRAPEDKVLKTADRFSHIFIGHTPTTNFGIYTPITRAGVTNIDTGCGKGFRLTIMDTDSMEYWQSD